MAGATFLRADLHVHTHADSDASPDPDLNVYVETAIQQGIDVLAITDHNRVDFVRRAMTAAEGKPLLVLPGIEISTYDGHLLAIFPPEKVEALEELAQPGNLKLKTLSDTEKRSERSMIDLIGEIYAAGGLAIPAHVDVKNGAASKLSGGELQDLLKHPGLAGLEFASHEALATWFTDADPDQGRLAAWKARQKETDLKARGLARLMSSDAHSPDQVGRDRKSRTLTRLRIDDANFAAVKNAIVHNPKARCKAEVTLPATYPRITSASFSGGFLDGVTLDFSDNLNCLIGGRGSGKSTALLAIRAALGGRLGPDEDADDAARMPAVTTVKFIDTTGAECTAVRQRGGKPVDEAGAPIRLRLADLGQEETGRLAQGYNADPGLLLEFLDGFVVRHRYEETEAALVTQLTDNAAQVSRTSGITRQIKDKETEQARLEASLKAATTGRVEEIAKWATTLASQGPLLAELDARIDAASKLKPDSESLGLEGIATQYGVDLTGQAAAKHVEGEEGLRVRLEQFEKRRSEIRAAADQQLAEAATTAKESLAAWNGEHGDLGRRLAAKQAELEAQGLKVQAGAVKQIADRLNEVKTNLVELRKRNDEHADARKERKHLLDQLHHNREKLFLERKAVLRRISAEANSYADDLTIRVSYNQAGTDAEWTGWLSEKFGFRQPRVARLAALVSPREFAADVLTTTGQTKLLALKDPDSGNPFFTSDQIQQGWKWDEIFRLETMRLPDRARIEVQRTGETERHQFDHLSAGQQRSVLLGLLLCAERNEPLVLDQPEDHLDGQYIAGSVVRHLEAAKERRQVIIATHSANLTVLGDAELVVPMSVKDGKGHPSDTGAVDRPETREQVCLLLEGGVEAYQKRGHRYGLRFEA